MGSAASVAAPMYCNGPANGLLPPATTHYAAEGDLSHLEPRRHPAGGFGFCPLGSVALLRVTVPTMTDSWGAPAEGPCRFR